MRHQEYNNHHTFTFFGFQSSTRLKMFNVSERTVSNIMNVFATNIILYDTSVIIIESNRMNVHRIILSANALLNIKTISFNIEIENVCLCIALFKNIYCEFHVIITESDSMRTNHINLSANALLNINTITFDIELEKLCLHTTLFKDLYCESCYHDRT